jgi:hypothetical protein
MTLAQPPIALHTQPNQRRLRPSHDHHPAVEGALWLAWTIARYTKVADLLRGLRAATQRFLSAVDELVMPDTVRLAVRPTTGRPADWRTRLGIPLVATGALTVASSLAWLIDR